MASQLGVNQTHGCMKNGFINKSFNWLTQTCPASYSYSFIVCINLYENSYHIASHTCVLFKEGYVG